MMYMYVKLERGDPKEEGTRDKKAKGGDGSQGAKGKQQMRGGHRIETKHV